MESIAALEPPVLRAAPLSAEDRAAFRNDGFVILRGAFARDAALIQRWAQDVAELPEISGRQWVFHERSQLDPARDLIARIERIVPFHNGFALLCDALAAMIGELLGEPAVLFKEKINFKMPGGDGFKPHQDSQAGWETYASYFVTAALTIDPSTLENGCLRVAAGQQRRGLFRAWEPLTDADMAGMNFVDCPTEPGDVILFDSYTPHASEPNHSKSMRRMYFATFNKAAEGDHMDRYYADKHKNYPPDIDRDPTRTYVFRV
jgi:2-aminoethylphosphonate dioxygenase